MQKICVICGNEYEPYAGQTHRQQTCSKECRKQYQIKRNNEYKRTHKKQRSAVARKYINGRVICRICGQPIFRDFIDGIHASVSTMHDECVFADAAETINSGNHLNNAQIQRLYARGYTLKEFKEEFQEGKFDEYMHNMRQGV